MQLITKIGIPDTLKMDAMVSVKLAFPKSTMCSGSYSLTFHYLISCDEIGNKS